MRLTLSPLLLLLLKLMLAAAMVSLLANATETSNKNNRVILDDHNSNTRSRWRTTLRSHNGSIIHEDESHRRAQVDNDDNDNDNSDKSKIMASLESSLLSLLGFRRIPRPGKRRDGATASEAAHVPERMRLLYQRQKKLDAVDVAKRGMNVANANTVRTFVHEESEIDDKFKSTHRFRLWFNLSSVPQEEKLRAAELTLSRVSLQVQDDDDDQDETNEINDNDVNYNFKDNKNATRSYISSNDNNNNNSNSSSGSSSSKKSSSSTRSNSKKHRYVRLMVHDIVKPGVRGKSQPLLRLIDSKVLDIRSNATISLDVGPAIERWLADKQQNHGLLVQITGAAVKADGPHHTTEHVRLRRSLRNNKNDEATTDGGGGGGWQRARPTLYTYTDDGRKKMSTASDIMERRARRAALRKNRRKDGRENCRRHPLYVDFADVGWNDWIVAPPGYDAFYCHGDCPFPLADHLNSTNHAIVQNLVYSTNPALVPKACCVPTTLGSISMLYLDEENKVVLKNYQDMSVLGCGCR